MKRIHLLFLFLFISTIITIGFFRDSKNQESIKKNNNNNNNNNNDNNNNNNNNIINNNINSFNNINKNENNKIIVNNENQNKYYNNERLKKNHQNNGQNDNNKIPQHENYLKKKRSPRPNPISNINNKNNDQLLNNNIKIEKIETHFESIELSINKMNCENGGIGFSGECICSYGYSGDKCEIIDHDNPCTQVKMNIEYLYNPNLVSSDKCISSGPSICCWSKFRTISNISTSKLQDSNMSELNQEQHNEIIKSILTNYGPWNENDKKMIKYLIKSNDNDKTYQLKYNTKHFMSKHDQHDNHKKPKLAFVLMIHNIDMESIKLLFDNIYKPKHYYVIHIDNNFKDEILINELKEFINNLYKLKIKNNLLLDSNYPNNIEILETRFNGAWGSIALVYSEIASYTKLFDMLEQRHSITGRKEKWSHVINLSINDFPIKTIEKLEYFFSSNGNIKRNFLNEEDKEKEIIRYNKPWVECKTIEDNKSNIVGFNFENNYGSSSNNNNNENGICGCTGMEHTMDRSKYKEGSQWHFITYKFANYLISDFKAIKRLFSMKFSYIPDESFFQLAKSESYFFNETDSWDFSNYRFIPWYNSAIGLKVRLEEVENNFNNQTWSYFTRKVYTTDVKKAIIEKYLKD
ncbi:hypothetical protein RB653_007482 [Dictyostelium firmibasis]|uniref:protein xylosyltransferase n=1 Tax=Dictyostelium firmibasis TaxID=79012 RepID=A0AAN7TUN1_9MYCE